MSGIVLKRVKFSNMFSYGKDNEIDLTDNKITQLSAPNGYGKTSISLIIQELLFNKNIQKLKKDEILNRYVSDNTWKGSLEFSVDADDYEIKAERTGNKSKVNLLENGVDISDHKVLDTYKKIQNILGIDFEIFVRLTYQSNKEYLEFLTATDANKKKFLINLFNMEKYIEIGDKIKTRITAEEKELTSLRGELKSVKSFLDDNSEIPAKMEKVEVPDIDNSLVEEIISLKNEIKDYKETCSLIDKNNLYKEEREALKFDLSMEKPIIDKKVEEQYQTDKNMLAVYENEVEKATKQLSNLDLADTCYACGQPIDNTKQIELKEDLQQEINDYRSGIMDLEKKVASARTVILDHKKAVKDYEENQKRVEKFEQLSQLIREDVPIEYPDYSGIQANLKEKESEHRKQVEAQNKAREHNESVNTRNTKIDALQEQIRNFQVKKSILESDIEEQEYKVSNLNILKKAFSTGGIVAYKLENVTKDLEDSINDYLSLLSDGQFQIIFRLDKEKLNIIVISNGKEVSINSLSQGEFSRVQTSVLLAVRNTLAKIGGKNINLLFLDEIMAALDAVGKEKLIELLEEEEDLNVFLISHEFEHPLIQKINVIKEDNISRLE